MDCAHHECHRSHKTNKPPPPCFMLLFAALSIFQDLHWNAICRNWKSGSRTTSFVYCILWGLRTILKPHGCLWWRTFLLRWFVGPQTSNLDTKWHSYPWYRVMAMLSREIRKILNKMCQICHFNLKILTYVNDGSRPFLTNLKTSTYDAGVSHLGSWWAPLARNFCSAVYILRTQFLSHLTTNYVLLSNLVWCFQHLIWTM